LWSAEIPMLTDYRFQHVALNADEDVFAVGYVQNLVDPAGRMDPSDLLAVKLRHQDGAVDWMRQLGTPGHDLAGGIGVDGTGDLLIGGMANGGSSDTPTGDPLAAKLFGATGEVAWVSRIVTPDFEFINGAAMDNHGNLALAGDHQAMSGQEKTDAFVVKLDGPDVAWTETFGSPEADYAASVACDRDGNPVVAGYVGGDVASDGWRAGAFIAKVVRR
jgi:hypothetical protein